jgi:hypothetical protein
MEQWGFECGCCGEFHTGLPMCIALRAPTLRATLPPQEREDRCFLTDDLCVIDDERFFVYGSLAVPVSDGLGPFIWGVWAEVSEEDFFRFQDLFGVEGRETEPSIPAKLGSDIPLYPPMLELNAFVVHQPAGERPLIMLSDSEHPLYLEQSHGVTTQRVREILEWHLHRPR